MQQTPIQRIAVLLEHMIKEEEAGRKKIDLEGLKALKRSIERNFLEEEKQFAAKAHRAGFLVAVPDGDIETDKDFDDYYKKYES